MNLVEEQVRFIVLHWVRCIALIGPLPVFGNSPASRFGRVGLGVMLGTILSLTSSQAAFEDPGLGPRLGFCVAKEALFGFLLGYVVQLAFAAIRIAGDFVGTEMGFNIASINDPVTGVNTQIMAHLFESIGMVLFFAVGAHLSLMRALAASFRMWPVTTFSFDEEILQAIIEFSSGIFAAGLQIAAPVFVAMLVTSVALAILSKVAPQLQVMIFAFPVKILGGLLLIIATLTITIPQISSVFAELDEFIHRLLVGA